MKQEYISPDIEIYEFKTEDVITTSNTRNINSDGSIDLPPITIKD